MHDLVITGGMVVDGTGAPQRRADVAVDGGLVVAVGHDVGAGREQIDARGCAVTPGFIDPHTHLDVQLFWDAQCAPSSMHGVTTVVLSNCGFGVAPCPEGGGEYLLRSLERVEEIPYSATSLAVPFNWRTWSEYADAVAALPLGVNVASYVAHSPLRYSVMGNRARKSGAATPEELQRMSGELDDAMAAGAVGFATSRGGNHVDAFGNPVPSRNADDRELRQLAQACRGRMWQINVATKTGGDPAPLIAELQNYVDWSRDAGALLTWTPMLIQSGMPWREGIAYSQRMRDGGTEVRPQILAMPLHTALRFDEAQSYQLLIKGWRPVFADWADLDAKSRMARLRSREARDTLRAGGIFGSTPFEARFDRWEIARSATRPDIIGRPVIELSAGGGDPVDALFDLVVADNLGTFLRVPIGNDDPAEMAEALNSDCVLYGLGDSGAHVISITNFAYPTAVLSTYVRERGALSIEKAVREMTSIPAHVMGLKDRGELSAGKAADICVVDLERVALAPAETRADLPGGMERIYQGAVGYRAVLVNGHVTVRDDVSTNTTAGRFLRRS